MSWIAKPINKLNPEEKKQYTQLFKKFCDRGYNIPLSQTLTWGRAIYSSAGNVLLVYKDDLSCGGIVYSLKEGEWECVNGPLIDWKRDREEIKQELSMFIWAASKGANTAASTTASTGASNFKSFSLRPRLESDWQITPEEKIAFPIDKYEYTATTYLELNNLELNNNKWSINKMRPSMRRSIRRMQEEDHTIKIVPIVSLSSKDRSKDKNSEVQIKNIHNKLQIHANKKNFYLPNIKWFEGLLSDSEENIEIYWGTIEHEHAESCADAGILVIKVLDVAYYLFGYSNRQGNAKRNLNYTSLLHLKMIEWLDSNNSNIKIKYYDFNGYVSEIENVPEYAGVNFFKEGWNGRIKKYTTPCCLFTI
ncbi:MAG: hypothetical protein HQK51_07750 [Oligoflexia bacterium]|nr:hypothetical protein [Oligoflexia bacterium]